MRSAKSLADIFFAILLLAFIERVAQLTRKYCYDRKVWTAGQHVTIDESMIKYCGWAVAFVQYMPAKPIKHGIKVLCVCCAVSGIMLAYEVYCGNKDKKTDGTSVQVCDGLVKEDWNHHRYCASTDKESKSNCGVQMRNTCDDK